MWWLNDLGGHRILRHGGSYPGFRSCCIAAPDDGVALWLGLHDSDDNLEWIGIELMRELLGVPSGLAELRSLAEAAAVAERQPPPGRYVPVGTAVHTVGVWGAMRGGLTIRHTDAGEVWMRAPAWRQPFLLQHLGEGLFGTDGREIYGLSPGYFSVQLIGPPEQPLLVTNGRNVYAPSRNPRPWLPLDEVSETGLAELRAMVSDSGAP
jgi:hypothetical protein